MSPMMWMMSFMATSQFIATYAASGQNDGYGHTVLSGTGTVGKPRGLEDHESVQLSFRKQCKPKKRDNLYINIHSHW